MPKTISVKHRDAFASRLSEYIENAALTRCSVIFHGGEPLLLGPQNLVDFANHIRTACKIPVDVSLQTNGLLLDDQAIDILAKADVGVSLSLDGPKTANDKHRLTRSGRSSFIQTEQALKRLQKYPSIFAGVIAVIDGSTVAEDLFEYFDQFTIPRLDFLLPDAHWLRPPPGRDLEPDLYEKWLVRAFDVWFERYSHIPVRTFEALLDLCAGLPSSTDAFGFGDVSLLSIETDGSYHDLDVLKVTRDGATKLNGNVFDTAIREVALSREIEEHRRFLRKEGLSEKCQNCSIVDICGGGSLPHRFDKNGLANPTVYCQEMKVLVSHINCRLNEHLSSVIEVKNQNQLTDSFSVEHFELAEKSGPYLNWLYEDAKAESAQNLRRALAHFADNTIAKQINLLGDEDFESISTHPGSIAWSNAILEQQCGLELLSIDGHKVSAAADYLSSMLSVLDKDGEKDAWYVGQNDYWLRAPFGKAIEFEGKEIQPTGLELVNQAIAIVREWRPALAKEMLTICRAVQFVRDPNADPAKIVSFSDNSVPGVLYVSIFQGDVLIDAYDLADSLIHEHRHQKLYLLERCAPIVEQTTTQVVSPWREDLRPQSGLFHAIFVFVELRRFWIYIRDFGPSRLHSRALNQLAETDHNLKQAFATLTNCSLTKLGQKLADVLENAAIEGVKSEPNTVRPVIPVVV